MHSIDGADHIDGATRQLAAIQAGGHNLIVRVRQKVAAALDALDAGDFAKATIHLNEAEGFCGPLASAQQYIAIAEGSHTMRAADVETGMTLTNVGEVTDVNIESCSSPHCGRHITIKVGDHELKFHGDQEVYVSDAERESA